MCCNNYFILLLFYISDFHSMLSHGFSFLFCAFLQVKRISAADALTHPYLDEGRLRFHSCMCKCCIPSSSGRHFVSDFEPACQTPFSYDFEDNLTSVNRVKGNMFILIRNRIL